MNNIRPGVSFLRLIAAVAAVWAAILTVGLTPSDAHASSLTSTPSSVSYGAVSIGNKLTQTLAIKNVGTSSFTVTTATISNPAFSISSLALPFVLAPGGTTFFAVGFKPTSSGTFSGTLTIKNINGTTLVTVPLSGSTSTQSSNPSPSSLLTSTPSSVSFGTVPVGNKVTQTLTIKNSGSSTVTVTSAVMSNSMFSISSLTVPFSLAPGATTYFAVGFKPTTSGTFNGSLSIKNVNGTQLATVGLSGSTSSSTTSLVSSASQLSFGNETVGESTTLPITLKNTGNSSITISGVSISGSSAYSVTGGISGATLAAGQTAILNIVFAPKSTGTFNSTVTVVSTAASTAPTIAVSGSGVSNTGHSVVLNWGASSSSGVTGYNVYRSTVSGNSYTRINSSPTASLKYTDGNVASGETYYYVVTAVTSTGSESARSSQISAAIP